MSQSDQSTNQKVDQTTGIMFIYVCNLFVSHLIAFPMWNNDMLQNSSEHAVLILSIQILKMCTTD